MKNWIGCLIGVVFILHGCARFPVQGGKEYLSHLEVSVNLPKGWYKYPESQTDHNGWRQFQEVTDRLILSRTGFWIQQIQIQRVPHDKELNHTQKKTSQTMLPERVADLVEENILAHPGIRNARILSKSAETIGNQSGYKLVYTYKAINLPSNEPYYYGTTAFAMDRGYDGLTYKVAEYGFHYMDWFYTLIFVAPQRHYFEKDLGAFEKIKDSLMMGRDPSIKIEPAEAFTSDDEGY